jgi:hypothetical protein
MNRVSWVYKNGLLVFAVLFFTAGTLGAPGRGWAENKLFSDGFPNDLRKKHEIGVQAVADPQTVRPGETFTLRLELGINPGWHIYSMRLVGEDAELATQITMMPEPFAPQTPWEESAPAAQMDSALEKIVQVHQNRAEFFRSYRVAEKHTAGKSAMQGKIIYQACDNKICSLPKEIAFNAVVQVVLAE